MAVVGLGSHNAGFNELEEIEEDRENIRAAAAIGARALRDVGSVDEIDVDDCGDPVAAAEGSLLGLFYFDELKGESLKKPSVRVNHYNVSNDESAATKWQFGSLLATGQNNARRLMEMPANLMTPTRFASIAVEQFAGLNVEVIVRDRLWAEQMKMGSFLSVAKGSDEPPVFLEVGSCHIIMMI